jgi:hypothetical protein
MTPTELLASLDRHFQSGCPSLSTSQLQQHRVTGSCPGCRGGQPEDAAQLAAQGSA